MRYITETRNLFDINSVKKVSGNPSFSRNGNQITVSYGFPAMYQSANFLLDTSLVGKVVTITALAMTSGLNNTCIRIQWVANSGLAGGQEFQSNIITGNSFQKLTLRAVVPESPGGNFNNLCIMFYSNYNASLEDGVTYSSTFKDIMIELGDTATPYAPYGYLPMRRMKYKVSNVCQLLDKSKYPATQTINGVTFTNNGDGSYAVSGRSTGDFSYLNLINSFKLKKNHIYLNAERNNVSYCYVETVFIDANRESHWVNRYKADSNSTVRIGLIRLGSAEDIVTLFPQFFDLTEMYGAGHEPTTLEEFRADFPDDLYEYTPYCWASMKNIRYIDTTKNLFDYSKVNNLMYVGGYSVNQYFIKNGNKFTVTYPMSKGATYLDYIIPLKAGTYTLSLLAYGTVSGATKGYFGLVKVENDYKVLKYNKYAKSWLSGNDRQSYTLTIEEDGNYAVYAYSDYSNSTNLDSTFWDIQLELGDTATNYVPYGYLPLK